MLENRGERRVHNEQLVQCLPLYTLVESIVWAGVWGHGEERAAPANWEGRIFFSGKLVLQLWKDEGFTIRQPATCRLLGSFQRLQLVTWELRRMTILLRARLTMSRLAAPMASLNLYNRKVVSLSLIKGCHRDGSIIFDPKTDGH